MNVSRAATPQLYQQCLFIFENCWICPIVTLARMITKVEEKLQKKAKFIMYTTESLKDCKIKSGLRPASDNVQPAIFKMATGWPYLMTDRK